MKTKISFLLLGLFLISGCSGVHTELSSLDKKENIQISIENNQYLILKNEKETFYLSLEISSEKIENRGDLGIIFKDKDGILSIEHNFDDKAGVTAMINGVDFSKKLIEINGITYKLNLSTRNEKKILNVNFLFKNMSTNEKLILNTMNYKEFIDKNGNIYFIGKKISADNVGALLYPVNLNGEDIYSITFNQETGKIYGAKEKATMLMDGIKAKNIKTINYVGVFQTLDGEKAVKIDENYYILIMK